MSEFGPLLLGLGLGLRHAADADHVVALSTLVEREPSPLRAALIAVWWGAGHSASFLAVGALIVVFGVHVPAPFEAATELLVALMLIGLGIGHLRGATGRTEVPGVATPTARASSGFRTRPAAVGLVHGLAGSATIALLASTTIQPRVMALAHLGLFGVGSLVGMVLVTLLLWRALIWAGSIKQRLAVAAALLSIALGGVMLIELAMSAG